jgi:hypothetical protein
MELVHNNKNRDEFEENAWGAFPPSLSMIEYENWYANKGAAAYNNPSAADRTGDDYEGIEALPNRLMPLQTVLEKPDAARDLLLELTLRERWTRLTISCGVGR